MGGGCGSGQGNYQAQAANRPPTPKEAATALARLMEKQLGYVEGHIDPIALRLFLRAYWSRVSCWAHVIHDEKE